MNRMFLLTSALALAVIVSSKAVQAEDKDKAPSVKDVMETLHGEVGKGGLKAKVTTAFKDKAWDDVQAGAKDWVKQADALSKGKPARGGEASWKKLTTAYEKNAQALAEAADKKDAAKTKTALTKLSTSCGSCHSVHKPDKEK